MELILWRHAEALALEQDGCDLSRPLTRKGERQAKRMAVWLNQHMSETTRVLVSPALRCQQTAQALGVKFRTLPELGPEGSGEALLKAARWPQARTPILIVGHQPTLGGVAAYLLAGLPQPWTVKKGAVWWLRCRTRDELVQVVLQAVQSPDLLD
jgi:phosphohistidine phosphatase